MNADAETMRQGDAETNTSVIAQFMGHCSALRAQINEWVSSTLANRAIITPIPDTDGFTGRIKSLPSLFAAGTTEDVTLAELREKLHRYAERTLARGEELPKWDRAPVEVPAETVALVRVSRLRKLIIARGEQWGVKREKLPAHIIGSLLADFDQLITRHATAMASAPPETVRP